MGAQHGIRLNESHYCRKKGHLASNKDFGNAQMGESAAEVFGSDLKCLFSPK